MKLNIILLYFSLTIALTYASHNLTSSISDTNSQSNQHLLKRNNFRHFRNPLKRPFWKRPRTTTTFKITPASTPTVSTQPASTPLDVKKERKISFTLILCIIAALLVVIGAALYYLNKRRYRVQQAKKAQDTIIPPLPFHPELHSNTIQYINQPMQPNSAYQGYDNQLQFDQGTTPSYNYLVQYDQNGNPYMPVHVPVMMHYANVERDGNELNDAQSQVQQPRLSIPNTPTNTI